MANAIPSRIGQINGAGDPLGLFLKVFSGRVLTAFLRQAYFRDKHLRQTIASGKSAQFPLTGLLVAMNHIPGDEILGNILNNAERVINIEGKTIAAVDIADIDTLMNHYDYSVIVSQQIGQALAKKDDQDVARVLIMAARQTAGEVAGVYPNGLTSTETNALFATDGPTLVNGILDADVLLDQRDVPREDRYVTLRPLQYQLAIKDGRVVDVRFNQEATNLGGLASGTIKMIGGLPVGKTNNLINTNDVGNAVQPTSRQHDFSVTQALIHHKEAAGTVALTDVSMETWWDPLRQVNHMLGKYINGKDWLRAEAAVELQSAAPAG